ncbi:MAG: hypothetical protein V1787_01850 [Candidatus Micrarchaeota archaeon]
MRLPALCALALITAIASQTVAQCAFLEADAVASATVTQGVAASFPVSVTNHGSNLQPVYLSASAPIKVELEFDESHAVLGSGEQRTFTLSAKTREAVPGNYSIALEVASDDGAGSCSQAFNLSLRVNANTTPTPVPIDRIEITMRPSAGVQKFPGERQEYDIIVSNRYDEEVIVALSSADNAFEDSTAFSEKAFRVPANSLKAVLATVTVPPGTPGGIYPVILKAEVTTACCLQEFVLAASISVFGDTAALTMMGEPLGCTEARQGESAGFELALRNDGKVTGPFSLRVIAPGDNSDIVGLDVDVLELNPGERTWFNVTLSPSEYTPTGIYRFTLQARYHGVILYQKDFCYGVAGTLDMEITKPAKTEVRRCATEDFQFKLRNTGTLRDTYSVEARPLRGANVFTDPAEAFELSPGESQVVNVILGVSCTAPLGMQALETTIVSSERTRSDSFEVEILPDAGRQQFLKITAPKKISTIEGEPRLFIVSITNSLSHDAEETRVNVGGVPVAWLEIEAPKTIKSGATASYRVRIVPETPGDYELVIGAASGLEESSTDATLSVEPQVRALDYSYELSYRKTGNDVNGVALSLLITNNGNVGLTNINLASDEQGLDVSLDSPIGALAPGESRRAEAVIRPMAATDARTVSLRLRSSEGVSQTKAVDLPALRPANESGAGLEFPWKVAIIIVLLILIFVLLTKSDENYHV